MYHKDGTVDVKLLADLGYIADRLRNLEQKWDLTELKDLHRRIVLKFDDPPTSVLRLRETLAHTPTVPPGSPEQQEQEVSVKEEAKALVVIVADEQTPSVVVEESPEDSEASNTSNRDEDVNDCNEKIVGDAGNVDEKVQKLDQLEELVIAFYHSCGRRYSGCTVEFPGSSTARDGPEPSRARTKRTKKKHSIKKVVEPSSPSHQGQQQRQQPDPDRTMNQGADLDQDRDHLARVAPSPASSDTSAVPCIDTRQPSQPLRSIHGEDSPIGPGSLEREAALDDEEDTVTLTAETSSECCSQRTVVALAGAEPSPVHDRTETVAGSDTTTDDDNDENDEDGDTGGSGADANDEAEPGDTCTRRSTLEKDSSPSSRRCSLGGEFETDQNRRLRRRLSELTNNFCTPKQFQQLCDNLDSITDNDLKLLIRELKRKIEFAERMNWLCLSSRPRGPPHRKTSLPKHTDVKKRFLETCDTTLSDEVKAALRLPAFDSYEWEDWDVIHLMQTMFVELNLLEKFNIPIETLREWLYEVYKHYNDVPFHNYRHCFCVAQMMYAIAWHTNLVQRLGELEVLVLLVSCICHDLDHPGYNNIYQINARTELALRYNDISPLENHHCSIAFRLLEHPECNIFRNMSKEMYKDVREGIIRCILATDMARHNEILTQFQEATPEFDYGNKVHTNLLCMVLIKVADISNEARPMDVAEPWVDRLLQEFFAQSAAEKSEGLPVTPFMDPDKVSKPGSQVRFIGLVLLPLFEALGDLLPELTDLIITPVRVALDYYRRLNDAANKTRRSIAEAEAASSESGGSPQLPRSQSGISVKSRRSIPSQKSASRTSVDEPILIAAELHDLPEGSESGDSETATEVDVAEKTSKFKVDTESIHRKQSHPNSRKGSREKRPSMIGEYYTTGTRTRGSHGNIQHTNNRTYFGSNRAISLDQYSNNRRMSDGVPIQTVHSDNSVLYYHHQRQHRSLDHDTMYSSSEKSTSLNSTHDTGPTGTDPPAQHVPPPVTGKQRLGKLFGNGSGSPVAAASAVANLKNNNSNSGTGGASSSGAGKHFCRMLSFNQQQKLDKLRNNNNSQNKNNNNNNSKSTEGNGNNNNNNNNNNNSISNNKNTHSAASNSHAKHLDGREPFFAGAPGILPRVGCPAGGGDGGGIDGTISGSVGGGGNVEAGGGDVKGGNGNGSSNGPAGRTANTSSSSASSGSKSFLSRLRQLTGRLSFNFDSRESKKLQLLAANAPERIPKPSGVPKRDHRLEKSRTVDVGDLGPVAICGDSTMTGQQPASVSSSLMVHHHHHQHHHQHHTVGLVAGESFYGGGPPVVMNQPKSISPILMQHRHSEVLGLGGPAGAAARSRAYSLDVPIGGRHCCRSLSGSTTGGGAGSSCGGSHKSLTFSLNNRSLTEDNDGGSLALVSCDRKSGTGPLRNGTDNSLLLLADDPSSSVAAVTGGAGSAPPDETI
ncbi:high affinity cGMP-specific 3',5'-cyclic phosphodiesterase 9A [Anopheles marshallii]|uniref:high affinity cGMP-specific 3',5'-cyclic phosphodiesterase 9A n=1 Tax=Anopheles marshallii TaxID=1521116 RepID=UPI00237AB112|nr:high affinity cGMP-specific 3',5'-cyclic phosphodiesterase 9A [Anopheles marshallii]